MAIPAVSFQPEPPPVPDGTSLAGGRRCPNCGSGVVRRYCADCGQAAPRPDDYSLREHAADFIDQLASVDGRISRTMGVLVSRPGALTAAHLEGRRARYLRPLQLFLLVNLVLFVAAPRAPMFSYSLESYLRDAPPSPVLVSSLVQGKEREGTAFKPYVSAFDGRVDAQRRSLIILFAPALAVVLRLMFAWRASSPGVPHRLGEHLVFSLHVLAFIWLVVTGWGLLGTLSRVATAPVIDAIALGAVVALLTLAPAYIFFASRRVYRLSGLEALGMTGALAVSFVALLVAYRSLLFFTTYYTL